MHPAPSSSAALPALFTKSAGMRTSVSPLAAWMKWQTLPSAALLAPLAVIGLLACAAPFCKRSARGMLEPLLPPIRFSLGAALAFTAICLASQNLFIFLPEALAAMGKLPHTFLVPLIQGNLLVPQASLALLTLAAAYSCMLCLGKRGKNA